MSPPTRFRRAAVTLALVYVAARWGNRAAAVEPPPDEAQKAGITEKYFHPPPQVPDYFHDMDMLSVPKDGKPEETWPDQLLAPGKARAARALVKPCLNAQEILGRNTWMMWCGGNEAFWDWLAGNSHGFLDFVKLIDSRNRSTRWRDAGMVNEPGMRRAGGAEGLSKAPPEVDAWGLWLDQPENPADLKYRNAVLAEAFKRIENGSWNGATTTGSAENGYYETYGIEHRYDRPRGDGASGGYSARNPVIGGPTSSRPTTAGATTDSAPCPAAPEPGSEMAVPPPAIYGLSSGIIGLRLFPNPNFRGEARAKWDAKKFYNDPSYYNDPALVRPYRVGISCAFCHASAHPLNPPLDPASPRWENLSGSIGSQYLRMRAVFGNLLTKKDFVYHILDSQPPGTIDTSLIASDNINNTNTMNAIFGVPQRVVRSFSNPRESLAAPAATMPSLWKDPATEAPAVYKALIPQLLQSNDNPRWVPRVLLDGADSIGAYGALARVYLNIGTYHQQWILLHEPLTGFVTPQSATNEERKAGRVQLPFKIDDCQKYSTYWRATKDRVGPLRDYFLRITPTMPLLDAAGDYPDKPRVDVAKLQRGREVFARNCIVCHSSIQPESDFIPRDEPAFPKDHKGVIAARKRIIQDWEKSGEVWDHDSGQWLRDPGYQAWAVKVVEKDEFWRQNYLSTDLRVAVNYIGTNSARAMATNGINGHMWEDFASDTFRNLPSIGPVSYFNPFTQRDEVYEARHKSQGGAPRSGGGPGFYRPASLMSVWATAPFLHNNSLGHFNNDPSVKGRLEAFDDAIHKLLYLERRQQNSDYATPAQLAHDHGLIWRTPCETYLQIRGKDVPMLLRRLPLPRWLLEFGEWLTGWGMWRAVPTLVLVIAAFVILLKSRGRTRVARLSRYGAYALIVLGLFVGFLTYLDTGGFGDLKIGPIPAGTPVNLLANLNPEAPPGQLKAALRATVDGLTEIQTRQLQGGEKDAVMRDKIVPALLSVSKCPDFVMDKGHFYPWFKDMSPEEKEALIELLKTF